jgi:predicted AAA+ superfamily ATPase
LAHYLRLLDQANMLAGLEKYAGEVVRKRGSSPKFQVYNTAFLSAQSDYHFLEVKQDPTYWGQLVESAVGAYLLNQIIGTSIQLFYWRSGDKEVDFVLQKGNTVVALEVKTQGLAKTAAITAFVREFNPQKILQVGGQGLPLEQFFSMDIEAFF